MPEDRAWQLCRWQRPPPCSPLLLGHGGRCQSFISGHFLAESGMGSSWTTLRICACRNAHDHSESLRQHAFQRVAGPHWDGTACTPSARPSFTEWSLEAPVPAQWHGARAPRAVNHGRLELALFSLEVLLLLASYLATVLRGPGFVPNGWRPVEEEITRLAGQGDNRPLDVVLKAEDCLQFCKPCGGFKPPRAHHCSVCKRCVLWMDHHCPWTNTCVGHSNLKSFVLFVHYVTIACIHSFAIHCEAPVRLGLLLYRSKHGRFWKYLRKGKTILALVSCLGALVIVLLVGSLAWDMHWSLANNITMVEELVMDRSDMRRGAYGERRFAFPYDLGVRQNWELVMGQSRLSWLCPGVMPCDAWWPPLREGCGHFDLSAEQLAQKAYKLSKCEVVPVVRAYEGPSRCCCCGLHLCRVACRFGLGTACSGPPCGERHLAVQPGGRVLVTHREDHWIIGHHLSDGLELPEAWLPSLSVNADKSKKYEVPFQPELQGEWDTAAGRAVRVSGIVVSALASHVPYALRAEGASTVLLGCRLLECDGAVARWSNGDVWHRPAPDRRPSAGFGRCREHHPAEPKKDV